MPASVVDAGLGVVACEDIGAISGTRRVIASLSAQPGSRAGKREAKGIGEPPRIARCVAPVAEDRVLLSICRGRVQPVGNGVAWRAGRTQYRRELVQIWIREKHSAASGKGAVT